MANKIIIVGGGLIGMLSARALLQRGDKVTLLERGPFGGEASWAGGGILSPLYPWRYADPVNRLANASQQLYPALMQELQETTGIDPEWRQCGMLMLNVSNLEKARQWAARYHTPLQILTKPQLIASEPLLKDALIESNIVLLPEVAQVRNPRFIRAMQDYLQQHGAVLHADTDVAQILTGNDSETVTAVVTREGKEYQADKIVIANGAWSGKLLRQTNIDLPIHPVRGQMLLLKGEPGLLNRIVLDGKRYVIPRADGHIIVGSTIEEAGFDNSVTEQAREELFAFAKQLAPPLADLPIVKQWAGLRPGCGQGIPYIGEHPQIKGLYVNAGHFRNGIVMAPASAELLAQLIHGETPLVDEKPYSLREPRIQDVI